MSLSKTESQKLADAARTSQDAEELKQIAKIPMLMIGYGWQLCKILILILLRVMIL